MQTTQQHRQTHRRPGVEEGFSTSISIFIHEMRDANDVMAKAGVLLLLYYVVLMMMLSSSIRVVNGDASKDAAECSDQLAGMATCLPYVQGQARAPTPDCCGGLKQVLLTSKKCLCVIVKDGNDPQLGLNINVTLALTLPSICQAPANVSQCPALLHLDPHSAEAQVFYQYASKGGSAPAASSSPSPSVIGSPIGAPAAVAEGSTASAPQQSDGMGMRTGLANIVAAGGCAALSLLLLL